MFPQENEYQSLLPKNAHGSPNFDKAACTTGGLHFFKVFTIKKLQDGLPGLPKITETSSAH